MKLVSMLVVALVLAPSVAAQSFNEKSASDIQKAMRAAMPADADCRLEAGGYAQCTYVNAPATRPEYIIRWDQSGLNVALAVDGGFAIALKHLPRVVTLQEHFGFSQSETNKCMLAAMDYYEEWRRKNGPLTDAPMRKEQVSSGPLLMVCQVLVFRNGYVFAVQTRSNNRF